MVICKECERKFDNLDSLRRHRTQKHGVNAEQTYIDYILSGVKPTCKCGCGESVKFLSIEKGFVDYIRGHVARVNNNWGHNKEVLRKSHETQKKMHASGDLKIWNKGLTIDDSRVKDNIDKVMSNQNRGINISKKLKGVPKSQEHKLKIQEASELRWSNPDEREKQSHRLIERLIKNNYKNKKTKLEVTFQTFLEILGLIEKKDFTYQKQVSSALFDFYIHNSNLLIEVDGDFHHCNPNSIHKIPTFPIQIKTVGNDYRKNLIAEEKGFKLLRFWESDIKNKPEEIMSILRKELGL
jgi:very-short-patch-repair endonuclease